MKSYTELIKKAKRTHKLSTEEIVTLLQSEDESDLHFLYSSADSLRRETMGDDVHLRGIIEFSNHCERNCFYCGLRQDNQDLERYRIPFEEIVKIAVAGAKLGYNTLVLQSGEDFFWDIDKLCALIREIKQQIDVAITLSVGERSREEYKLLKDAGTDRYLLKHETANDKLYTKLHPDLNFANRIACLKNLRELGYQVGSGSMIGLPGQTLHDIAMDLLLLQELDVEMAGIGPFISHQATPLGNQRNGTLDLVYKTVAIARLLLPLAHLPATTATGSLDHLGREKVLQSGANVVMPNITPTEYRAKYEIYPNKICLNDEAKHCRGCIEQRIKSIGRTIALGKGDSPKWLVTNKSENYC